ncbi:MAG: protein-disulfide reductase DsbD domain-containing protein, partial [Xanthobacteraceae bacterium]
MTTGFDRLRPTAAPRVIAFCATVLIAASPATAADDASRWDGDARSAIRLVAGSSPAGQTTPMRAGLGIRLKPGWHTYWRYPGDAGVPPRFDFAGSQNVKAVEVLWPAPQRIPEEGMVAIGYTGDVMLPIAIVPQDVSKPVLLHLKLDYAVCEKLCVPAEGKAELLLTGGPSSQDAALAAAAARIPRKVALGQGTALAIKSVRREEGGGRPRIIVDVAAPPGTTPVLFAEGP